MNKEQLISVPADLTWILFEGDKDSSPFKDEEFILLKQRPHRKVFKGKEVFVKAFRLSTAERLFKRDGALKEFTISKVLYEQRARAPKPLGLGKWKGWRFFVSQRIEGICLDSFFKEEWRGLSTQEKILYIKKFSHFLSDLAHCGLMQPDFHLNNVLLDIQRDDFVLIDLHRAEWIGRPLSNELVCEQLRYILPSLSGYLSRYELLKATAIVSRWLPDLKVRSSRFFIQQIAYKDVAQNCKKKAKRRLKRILLKKKENGIRLLTTRSVGEDLALTIGNSILSRVNKPQPLSDDAILKDSKHTLCFRMQFEDRPYFIKCYRSSGSLKSLSYLVRLPRAIKAWNASWHLHYLGINTLLPIVAIQTPNPWNKIYGFIVYPWNNEVASTKQQIKDTVRDKTESHHMINTLAFFIWDMHQKGVFHGDCKITNFVLSQDRKDLMIFDLDSSRFLNTVPDRLRIKDLAVMARSLEKLTGSTQEVTQRLFLAYCRYHVPWQKDFHGLLNKVISKVSQRK